MIYSNVLDIIHIALLKFTLTIILCYVVEDRFLGC